MISQDRYVIDLNFQVVTTPITVGGQTIPMIGSKQYLNTVVKPMVVTVSGNGNAGHNNTITIPATISAASSVAATIGSGNTNGANA